MSEQETALTKHQSAQTALAKSMPADWAGIIEAPQTYTSLDMTTPTGKAKMFDALEGDCKAGKEYINKTLKVADFVMHKVTSVNPDTGECQEFIRTVLIGPRGEKYAFGSKGVVKSLMLYQSLHGSAPFKPALSVVPTVKSLAGGRQYYSLKFPGVNMAETPETAEEDAA